jgi:hypothetical protein
VEWSPSIIPILIPNPDQSKILTIVLEFLRIMSHIRTINSKNIGIGFGFQPPTLKEKIEKLILNKKAPKPEIRSLLSAL